MSSWSKEISIRFGRKFFFFNARDLYFFKSKMMGKAYILMALVADQFLCSWFLRLSGLFGCYQGRGVKGHDLSKNLLV